MDQLTTNNPFKLFQVQEALCKWVQNILGLSPIHSQSRVPILQAILSNLRTNMDDTIHTTRINSLLKVRAIHKLQTT